ncbi:MAG: hypothetical protein D6748_10560 [Calditrichaeota bacterium]|nr:MAG: hypothetical protein D6748_10560 [Calditrichota bacterium]
MNTSSTLCVAKSSISSTFSTITSFLFMCIILSGLNAQHSSLNTYGYFDLEAEVSNRDSQSKHWTFDQHHLNFLAIYTLDDHFRVFTEIEWEHGVLQDDQVTRGRIYVARAFLNYHHSDGFTIQAGKFLPPFGIYNELHDATPTFLFTILPMSIYGSHLIDGLHRDRLFAKLITGVKVSGNHFFKHWQFDYQVYLGNGRGPNPDEKDNNSNKGLGGQLRIHHPSNLFSLGASFYTEKNGDFNNLRLYTPGVDFQLDFKNLHLQSEIFFPFIERMDNDGNPLNRFRKAVGWYIQEGYTIRDKITPFSRFDLFDSSWKTASDYHTDTVLGVNIALSTEVFWKGEVHFFRYSNPSNKDYELFITSIAVAF